MKEELYEEDLRSDFMELVEKYAKPLCKIKLNEDEVTEVTDELRSTFHGYIDHIDFMNENERLRKRIEKLQDKLCVK